MAPPGKRRRKLPSTDKWKLPADVLLEIVALSDLATLVRCAAACKPLRRYILDQSFLGRVTQPHGGIMPLHVLAYLHNRPVRSRRRRKRNLGPLVSLVHPATSAAKSFTYVNLAPYMSRHALDILCRYDPLASRRGLVLLRRRRNVDMSRMSSERCCPDLCVLNLVTGDRTYLSAPPGLCPSWTYALLTDADGISCSFLLLATNVDFCDESGVFRIKVRAAKTLETGGTSWGPLTSHAYQGLPFMALQHRHDAVILHGGIIHWLVSGDNQVLTYDIRTDRLGTVMLPPTNCIGRQRILGKSPNGMLRLLTAKRFKVSVWLQDSHGWMKGDVIDVKKKLQLLHPEIVSPPRMPIEFESSGERSGVVLLRAHRDQRRRQGPLIVLDLETKEMNRVQPIPYRQEANPSLLFEVDLLSRLRDMKIFS